jgi:putative transposase
MGRWRTTLFLMRRYPTDLTDAEWECIAPYFRSPNKRGRPKIYSLRHVLDAVFYVLRSGCAWRMLTRDFPPWRVVYYWFRKWRIHGTWEGLNAALRERLGLRLGRHAQPSAGIADSQSAKTSGAGGEQRGYEEERNPTAGNVTCWWIRRDWSSKPRYTVPRSRSRTDYGFC